MLFYPMNNDDMNIWSRAKIYNILSGYLDTSFWFKYLFWRNLLELFWNTLDGIDFVHIGHIWKDICDILKVWNIKDCV